MEYKKIWRILVLAVLAAAIIFTAAFSCKDDKDSCMGVKILSEAEMSRFTNHVQQELSGWIKCSGNTAATDAAGFTVYVSQNISKDTIYTDLSGRLSIDNPQYKMYFAPDEMFADIYTAVRENHGFKLIIAMKNGEYSEYSVVFTTLPVVNITGQFAYTSPEGDQVYDGSVTIWDGNYAGTGGITAETTSAKWYADDRRDVSEEKTSWRMSFRTESNAGNMLNLTGQGKDDDWIFNSISGDDTKIREKLAASLWNAMNDETAKDEKMPEGEYAEIVYNGSYMGIYLIQRRTDQKFLDLDSNDLLLRDKKERRGSYAKNNYSVRHSYYTDEEVWQIVDVLHSGKDYSVTDVENWIDVNLFVNAVCNKGRLDYTEMYYNWQNVNSMPEVKMIPVLSDSLWGITVKKDKFRFDEGLSDADVVYRCEYEALKEIYPNLDEKIADRYRYLRGTVLNEEYIEKNIGYICSSLENSGAVLRDSQRWEYSTENDKEKLKDYIEKRLEKLDVYYGVI